MTDLQTTTDLTSQGNWQPYGTEGGFSPSPVPLLTAASCASLGFNGQLVYSWANGSPDARTLGGTAACWYSHDSFTATVNLKDNEPHQVSAYFLDWDNWQGGRRQQVTVFDGGGNVIDDRVLSGFQGGVWITWTLSGTAMIRIRNLNPASDSNAVLNALMFSPAKPATTGRLFHGIPYFPADFFCNVPVNLLPYDVHSDAIIASLGTGPDDHLGPDPEFYVNAASNKTPVPPLTMQGGSEVSDAGSYPIAPDMIVSIGGSIPNLPRVDASTDPNGDRHLLAINIDTHTLYEHYQFQATKDPNTGALAFSNTMGCLWDLDSYQLRPAFKSGPWVTDDSTGITSTDAAGTPIAPLVYTLEELSAAVEPPGHMGRICFPFSLMKKECQWPASHMINHKDANGLMPLGAVLVLDPNFDIVTRPDGKKYLPQVSRMLKWGKSHGWLVDDIGHAGLVGTDLNPGWGDPSSPDSLNWKVADDLHQVKLSQLKVVDMRQAIFDIHSGQVKTAAAGWVRR